MCASWHATQVLEQLCKDVQAQAVLYQESIRDASELEDTTGVELYPAAAGGKARPMVLIKQVGTNNSRHAESISYCTTAASDMPVAGSVYCRRSWSVQPTTPES